MRPDLCLTPVIKTTLGPDELALCAAMEESPLELLVRLAHESQSGELIVVADGIEVHAYLLLGRLAWATSSSCPNAFGRYVVEHCHVDPQVLAGLIEECRLRRRRLGEALIAHGILDRTQVKEALRSQITSALVSIESSDGPRCLFLPRQHDYDPALTFAVAELLDSAGAVQSVQYERAEALLTQLQCALPDSRWLAVAVENSVVSWLTGVTSVPEATLGTLAEIMAQEPWDTLVLRSPHGLLIGTRVADTAGSVWCALPPEARMGVVMATVAAIVGQGRTPPTPASSTDCQAVNEGGLLNSLEALEIAMDKTDDLVAAGVLHGETGRQALVRRAGCDGLSLPDLDARVQAIRAMPVKSLFGAERPHVNYEWNALNIISGDKSYFCTLISQSAPVPLWLVLRRCAVQGIGWALLTTLARQMADCVVLERR